MSKEIDGDVPIDEPGMVVPAQADVEIDAAAMEDAGTAPGVAAVVGAAGPVDLDMQEEG